MTVDWAAKVQLRNQQTRDSNQPVAHATVRSNGSIKLSESSTRSEDLGMYPEQFRQQKRCDWGGGQTTYKPVARPQTWSTSTFAISRSTCQRPLLQLLTDVPT
jgi:hypothetical protein